MRYRYRANGTRSPQLPQRRARQRIIDAAVDLYGAHGFDAVTIKQIAQRARVSAPLVIHHFTSAAGLRAACDRFVADQFRAAKTDSVRLSGPMPRNYAMESIHANRHLMKYLLRALAAGGEQMDQLFDTMVEDALQYTAEAEQLGLVYPSSDPRRRAVVMLLQSFGALMLHRQMKRHLGASPLEDSPEALLPYIGAVMELYTQPVINAEMYEELLESQREFDHHHHSQHPDAAAASAKEGSSR